MMILEPPNLRKFCCLITFMTVLVGLKDTEMPTHRVMSPSIQMLTIARL